MPPFFWPFAALHAALKIWEAVMSYHPADRILAQIDHPPATCDVEARCRSLRRRWNAAWATCGVPGVYPARPYPLLDDQAAWERLDQLERHIAAKVER